MAGSASGQDKANPVFCLATRDGKMGRLLLKLQFRWLTNVQFPIQGQRADDHTLSVIDKHSF